MVKKPDKRTILVARHEAAHAVVGEYLGYTTMRVALTKGGEGFCDHRVRTSRLCPFERGLIALAGTCAEQRWHRLRWGAISRGDYKTLRDLGFKDRAVVTLQRHARALVEELAPQIEAVAQELKKRDLTGRDVRRILRSK